MSHVRASTLVLSAILWLSVLTLALLGPVREHLAWSFAAYSVAFGALLLLYRWHGEVLDDPRLLLGGAIVLRLTIFPTLPDLSDDLFRYTWDGWMSFSGVNPFRFTPADPQLAPFHDSDLFASLNSPDYHSIYPPLSQIVFLLGGVTYMWMGWPAAAFAIKGGFALLEAGGLVLLLLAVRAQGLPLRALALYALNPLVLVTLIAGGHSEGALIFGLGVLAYAVVHRKRRLSWIGLVFAAAAKGLPILLAPLLLRRESIEIGWRQALGAALPGAALGLGLLAPFYYPGLPAAVGSSADLYVRLFEFNAGLYFALKEAGLWLTGLDLGKSIGPLLRGGFLIGTGLIWLKWDVHRDEEYFRAGLAVFGLYLVTATTVHPWYLTWGLALVPFTPYLRAAWIWGSWAAFATYFAYVGTPQGPLAALFWGGVGLLFLKESEGAIRDRLLWIAGKRKARQVAPHLLGPTVLDLGAGEGYVSAGLAKRKNCLLADLSPSFRVRLPGLVYDGLRLPLSDGSVDTVLLSLVLHHAENPGRVIAEALRVARRRVVITESTYRWAWERHLLDLLDGAANRGRGRVAPTSAQSRKWAETRDFRTVEAWEATFRGLGAHVVESRRLNHIGHRHHLFVIEKAGEAIGPVGRATVH